MGQILTNSRMSAMGHRPICQDTGSAVVFLDIGMNVQWDLQGSAMSVEDMVNEGYAVLTTIRQPITGIHPSRPN